MSQTRLGSFIETLVNIAIGFTINWIANIFILPMYGFNVTGGQAFSMGLMFTVISVIRSYSVRRWFNSYIVKASTVIAKEIEHEVKTH